MHVAPHTAAGPGLHSAIAGTPTSFTVRLAGENGADLEGEWNVDKKHFIYVWVANEDNIFIAGVENNGDGTLTAEYKGFFPGTYLVHVEDVNLHVRDETDRVRPIVGSPFSLTISGEVALDVNALPVCGTQEEDVEDSYWRAGSWVSSNVASAKHGVLRDGWVFQPEACVHDTFSYDDLMLLASLEEPTWLLAMGNSILRGIFLSLVDMVLARGQKDNLGTSDMQKCWGFVDIRIGNLRLTYQVRSLADQDYSFCPSILSIAAIAPVARYSACETAWHRWEQPVVAACGVVPVADIGPVFPAGTYRQRGGITIVHQVINLSTFPEFSVLSWIWSNKKYAAYSYHVFPNE